MTRDSLHHPPKKLTGKTMVVMEVVPNSMVQIIHILHQGVTIQRKTSHKTSPLQAMELVKGFPVIEAVQHPGVIRDVVQCHRVEVDLIGLMGIAEVE